MNTVIEHTNETQPSSPTANTIATNGHQSGSKKAAATESRFNSFLHKLTSAHHSLPQGQAVASHKKTAPKTDATTDTTAKSGNPPQADTKTSASVQSSSTATKPEPPSQITSKTNGSASQDTSASDKPPSGQVQNQTNADLISIPEKQGIIDPASFLPVNLAKNGNSDALAIAQTSTAPANISIVLQDTEQSTAPAAGSADTPANLQISQGNLSFPSTKQDANTRTIASDLQNTETVNFHSSASSPSSTQQAKAESISSIKPSTTSLSAQALDDGNIASTDPNALKQVPNAQVDNFFKNLISSIKDVNVSEASDPEVANPASKNGNKGQSAAEAGTLTGPGSLDLNQVSGHETALLQQTSQAAHVAANGGEVSPQSLTAARTVHYLDPSEDKTHLISSENRLAVSLEPEGLGKLNINLSLSHGLVNAQIQATDPTAKSLIESNIQQIMNSLQHEGFNVGGFSVSLKQNETGNTDEQSQNNSSQLRQREIASTTNISQYDVNGHISLFV